MADAGKRPQRALLATMEPLDWHLAGPAVHPLAVDIERQGRKVRLQCCPALEKSADNGVLLHVTDLHPSIDLHSDPVLALGLARYGAQARGRDRQCLAKAFGQRTANVSIGVDQSSGAAGGAACIPGPALPSEPDVTFDA